MIQKIMLPKFTLKLDTIVEICCPNRYVNMFFILKMLFYMIDYNFKKCTKSLLGKVCILEKKKKKERYIYICSQGFD